MVDLSKDLSSLRIPQEERGGRRGRTGVVVTVLILLGLVAGGAWLWTAKLQAEPVKVAPVAARAGGPSAPGSVMNASG
jgi:hypothetical protein